MSDSNGEKESFKQLTILRKALSEKHTGKIIYERQGSTKKTSLCVTVGDLLNDEETLGILEDMLKEPVKGCKLKSSQFDKRLEAVTPPEVFSKVMNKIHWHPETLKVLKETFEKLPPIDVRMVSMHRYGYHDGLTYLSLYQASLKDEDFSPKKYLQNQNTFTTLEQQIKALVLGYCLGLIKPSKQKKVQFDSKNETKKGLRSSMATRILEKIRGKS